MIIGIGSTNPAKVVAVKSAVRHAHRRLGLSDPLIFRAMAVASGVAAQPFSDVETRQGAINRAKAVLAQDSLVERAFGLEGGVAELPDGLYSTVWICVIDRLNQQAAANGNRFLLPVVLAEGIRRGQEMGDVMDELCHTTNLKHREGMIGVVTRGVVTRTESYAALARLAYGLWLKSFSPVITP